VNSEKPITTLHLIWGREAVSRYKLGMVDNIVRLAHSVYDFMHPALADAFVLGVREAREADDWLIITNPMDIKKLGMPLRNRLIEAARKGDVEAVKALVNTGVKLDATDGNGLNALHHAAMSGKADVVAALVDAGVDVDCRTGNGLGKTPLHLANESDAPGTAMAVHVLVENKADVNARDNKGNTPLHSLTSGNDAKPGSADAKARSLLEDGGADPRNENKAHERPGETLGSALAASGGVLAIIMTLMHEQDLALSEKEAARLSSMKRMGAAPNPMGIPGMG
jgi:Ankyrin repeats (3 copies)